MKDKTTKVTRKTATGTSVLLDSDFETTDSEVNSYLKDLKPENIPVASIFGFKGHPYSVVDDHAMEELTDSINEHGIITPTIVRPMGEKYEMISGHRRLHAAEKLGLQMIPAYVKPFNDLEAVTIMTHSNIQRKKVLPSEKAKAFKMQYEAMKHQGKSGGGSSLDQIAEANGISSKQVQNYISLTKLSEENLKKLDEGKLTFTKALELAKLPVEEQTCENSAKQDRSSDKTVCSFKRSELSEFFSGNLTNKEMKTAVLEVLRQSKVGETKNSPANSTNA